MTYKTIAPNVLADEFGHKVRILGRTGILHSFAGREIQIGSEMLVAGFGFAIYGDWSKLVSPGNGGPDLQDEEVVTAIDEIVKALRDIGERVEIATHHKMQASGLLQAVDSTLTPPTPALAGRFGQQAKPTRRLLPIAILGLLSAVGVSAAINPMPPQWNSISVGDDGLKAIATLGKPDALSGGDTSFWVSRNAWLTFPIFYRYLEIRETECAECQPQTYTIAEKRTAWVLFYFFEWAG